MRVVHASARRPRRTFAPRAVRAAAYVCAIAALWYGASVPWGMSMWHIIPFIAPGALLGLGAGWTAHAATRWHWTWRAAARSAVVGAMGVAPFLVFFVGIEGNVHPERLLLGFVRVAWLALAAGGMWAVIRYARVRRARQAPTTASSRPPASRTIRRRA